MTSKLSNYSIVMLLLLTSITHLLGQEHYNIPLSSAKYFDNAQIYETARDTSGYLWVGTDNGVYRYDGGQAIPADNLVTGMEDIRDRYTPHLCRDRYNRIWLNPKTEGIAMIDPSTNTCNRISIKNKSGQPTLNYTIQSIACDDNYLWASLWSSNTIDGGVLRIDLKTLDSYITTQEGILVPGLMHLDHSDTSTLWITGESLTKFDKSSFTYREIEYDSTINADHLVEITQNKRGNIFIIYRSNKKDNLDNKVVTYNTRNNEFEQDTALTQLSFSPYDIKMYNDSMMIITSKTASDNKLYDTYNHKFTKWPLSKELLKSGGRISTLDNGEYTIGGDNLNYIKRIQKVYRTIPIEKWSTDNQVEFGTGHYDDSRYVFPKLGSRNHYYSIDTNTYEIEKKQVDEKYNYRALYNISSDQSLAVARDAIAKINRVNGKVETLITIDEYLPNEKSTKLFFNSCDDSNGNVWVATSHNTVLEYNIVSDSLKEYKMPEWDSANPIFIFDITADNSNNIFVAGRYEVFYKANDGPNFERLSTVFPNTVIEEGIIPYSISCIDTHEILLGTWANRTFRIDLRNNNVYQVGPELDNIFIESIRKLPNGKFIFLSNGFIVIYNAENDEYRYLDKRYGTDFHLLRNPAVLSLQGKQVISAYGDFIMLDTDSLLNSKNQKFIVSKLAVNGIRKNRDELLQLHHEENDIEIDYALAVDDPYNHVKYRYKLTEDQDEWTHVGNKKNLMFPNLTPGYYPIQIQSTNIDGFWIGRSNIIEINISPPWYDTWWSKLLALLIALSIIYSIIKNYIRTQKRNLENEKRFAQLETMILKSQMNPHFIFNSLNSIRYLFMKDQKDKGLQYITKFAKLLRSTLHHGETALVKLSEELELTELFIELEQLRFDDKFEYTSHFDTSDEWKSIDIPPFVIQPLVENAFWHGLSQSDNKDKQLQIKIEKNGIDWLIHVIDNGIGIGNSNYKADKEVGKKKSYGLSLIKERFDLINTTQSNQYQISIKPIEKNKGTMTTISITPRA